MMAAETTAAQPTNRIQILTNHQVRPVDLLDFEKDIQMTSCPNSHRNHIESNVANKPTQQSVVVTTTNTELKKHPLILPDIKMSKSKNGSTEAVINGDVVILAARHF